MPDAQYLLDTHVWIWLAGGDATLSDKNRERLLQSSRRAPLLVPAISVWEIGMLVAKERLSLSMPLAEWVEGGLSEPGVALAPLSPEIAIDSTQLPGDFHGDPADRMIVATARVEGAVLATRDRRILDYAEAGHVGALAV